MLLVDCNREDFYKIIYEYFEKIHIKPSIAEVGVLRGENALNMIKIIKPASTYLIDSYSPTSQKSYKELQKLHSFMHSLDEYSEYYSGSLHKKSTYNRLNVSAKKLLSNFDVKFIKKESLEAIKYISEDLDYVYIDGNHNYENVLEDLVTYSKKLKEHGIIQLNDVVFSESSHKQNVGVIDALNRFLKTSDFQIVALNLRDWSDALIARKKFVSSILNVVSESKFLKVMIPNALLGSYKIKYKDNSIVYIFDE